MTSASEIRSDESTMPQSLRNQEVLASVSGVDGSHWQLSLISPREVGELEAAIRALGQKTRPPNPFFEWPFLSAAYRKLGTPYLQFLSLTEQRGTLETLKLFAPVRIERCGLPPTRVLRVWSTEYAPSSLPLTDGDDLAETVSRFAQCLNLTKDGAFPGVLFEDLLTGSTFTQMLLSQPALTGRLQLSRPRSRAFLHPHPQVDYASRFLSGKRRQRLRRAKDKLEQMGAVKFSVAITPAEIADGFEAFLQLESQSWKGRRGTAMRNIADIEAFARDAVSNLADEEGCSVYSMQLNNETLSSLIMLHTHGWFFAWKTAYDERFAEFSAGNLLIAWINEQLLKESRFKGLDSLAAPDNENANTFWPEVEEIADLAIGLGSGASQNARGIISAIDRKKQTKRVVKQTLRKYLKDRI